MAHSIFEYAIFRKRLFSICMTMLSWITLLTRVTPIVFNVVVFISTSFHYNAKIFILFDVVFKVAHYLYFKEKSETK